MTFLDEPGSSGRDAYTCFAICMMRCYRYDLLLADEATPFEVQINSVFWIGTLGGIGCWVFLGEWFVAGLMN